MTTAPEHDDPRDGAPSAEPGSRPLFDSIQTPVLLVLALLFAAGLFAARMS
jgi:hypothetical protein